MGWLEQWKFLAAWSGPAGCLSAVCFAVPFLRDLKNKRLWDALSQLKTKKGIPQNALLAEKWKVLDEVIGNYRSNAAWAIVGCVLLFVAFGLSVVGLA